MSGSQVEAKHLFRYPVLECDVPKKPLEPGELAPFKGDEGLNVLARSVQKKMRETQIARVVRELTFRNGRRPTLDETMRTYGITRRSLEDVLRRENLQVNPLPVVRTGELPDNQRAFFKGMSYGRLGITRVKISGHPFISVLTESADSKKRALVRATFGTWGEIRETRVEGAKEIDRTKVYLAPDTFGFIADNKGVGSSVLLSRQNYPPFLLGLMLVRLSGAMNRLSLSNPDQLKAIHRACQRNLGIPLGKFHIENREASGRLAVVDVQSPGEIFGALARVESVALLPFFRQIVQLAA